MQIDKNWNEPPVNIPQWNKLGKNENILTFYGAHEDIAGYILTKNNILHADNKPAVVYYGADLHPDPDEDGETQNDHNVKLVNQQIWYQNGIQFNPTGPSKVKYFTWSDISTDDQDDIWIDAYIHMLKGVVYYKEWTDETGKIIKVIDLFEELRNSAYKRFSDEDEDEDDYEMDIDDDDINPYDDDKEDFITKLLKRK